MEYLGVAIFGLIALVGVLILSVRFDLLKYIVLTVLGISKIIASFYIGQEFGNVFYIIFGTLFFMFYLGEACFDLDTKDYSEILIERINNTLRFSSPTWSPIKTLFSALFGGAIIVGIAVLLCNLFNISIVLTIISIVESIIAVISLIQWFKYR